VQIRIVARLRQAEAGSLGDWKSVSGAVSEMRVDVGRATGSIHRDSIP
jgi:putative component of toxin-antitoxin plasmid stabilization module